MRYVEDVVKQRGMDSTSRVPLCNRSCIYFDTFENRGCHYQDHNKPKGFLARIYHWFSGGEDVPHGSPCTHPEVHTRA